MHLEVLTQNREGLCACPIGDVILFITYGGILVVESAVVVGHNYNSMINSYNMHVVKVCLKLYPTLAIVRLRWNIDIQKIMGSCLGRSRYSYNFYTTTTIECDIVSIVEHVGAHMY
jgi:hypothetical protein